MSSGKRRVFRREFKLSAAKRMMDDGERGRALCGELGVSANQLYKWCMHFRRGGAEALRPTSGLARCLLRSILRRIRPSDGSGVPASTRSSKR
jgi:transposase-like protein